jgi:hypothetical protein
MPTTYKDLPPINLFNTIITKLQNQITTTINLLSPDNKTNNYCYQTSDDLVKELLHIIYIPIKYDFVIKYIGTHIGDETIPFNPVIPDNITVSPSDISVISKLSLDIHNNSNTIHDKKRINQVFSNDSANAYMYMFQLAFGQLNHSELELSKNDIHNLTIKEELFDTNETRQIHNKLPLNHSGFNNPINDTGQSIWKSAFLYKKFALNVSFTTITLSSNGNKMSISILDPTIHTAHYNNTSTTQ